MIFDIAIVVVLIIQAVFFLIFILPFLNTIFSSLFNDTVKTQAGQGETDFALIITAYKNHEIPLPLLSSILKNSYANYHIYLVLDNVQIKEFDFKNEKLTSLIPETPLNSKIKSIKYAMKNFIREHENVIIFDPDNLAHPEYLKIMNNYISHGFKSVQGRRTAKNLDTVYACLDAVGEMYYNSVVRESTYKLGSSSVIAGSGMSVETKLYKEILSLEELNDDNKLIIAEDKILQYEIVKRGYRIAFAKDAIVYDEKVDTGFEVQKQKTRWLNSYFKFVKYAIDLILLGIRKFNFNIFFFGLNVSIPPLIIINGIAIFLIVANIFFDVRLTYLWIAGYAIFLINLCLILLHYKADSKVWKSLIFLPVFLFKQFLALLTLKRSDKDFLVTEKKKIISVEDVMKDKE